MSVEAILTVLGVALAVMALVPRERAQDLRIRLGGSVKVVGGIASALVLYWAFLDQIHRLPGLKELPRSVSWLDTWNPANLSLLVLLLATAHAWWSYQRPLPISRVQRLASAIADSLARRNYGECLHLVETHLATLQRSLTGQYWQARLRSRLFPTFAETFARVNRAVDSGNRFAADAGESIESSVKVLRLNLSALKKLRVVRGDPVKSNSIVHRFTQWAEGPREAAADVVRQVSLAPRFASELASANPYLGLRLLSVHSTWIAREFAEDFSRALFSDPDSVLYRELRRSENVDADSMPILDPREQPLLSALYADAVRTEGPIFLHSFLIAGINPLRWDRDPKLHVELNGPIADFRESGRWISPPFATLYLLAIIAPRVAVNPSASFLNLYILRTLGDELLSQLEPSEHVDHLREWPTPSHYLLSSAVSLLCDLVMILKIRPEALQAVRAARQSDHDSSCLPEHAIEVLGSVMFDCLKSDRLDGRFKGYLLELWWEAYSDKYRGDWERSADVLDALARGGQSGGGDMRHRSGMEEALSHIDILWQRSKAATALRIAFGLPAT